MYLILKYGKSCKEFEKRNQENLAMSFVDIPTGVTVVWRTDELKVKMGVIIRIHLKWNTILSFRVAMIMGFILFLVIQVKIFKKYEFWRPPKDWLFISNCFELPSDLLSQ